MWIFWAAAVFISSIVFLNFIIAVISESYEKVMQKATANAYKEKVNMIQERESQFTDEDFNNDIYFPKYLVVRNPVEGGQGADEWQGFIKDIKSSLSETKHSIKNSLVTTQKKLTAAMKATTVEIEAKVTAKNGKDLDILKKQSIEMKRSQEIQTRALQKLLKKFDIKNWLRFKR